ncbi:MAG: cupin domain-containing protein [Okeania sp. SIO3I5]|uniref:cupin domain-containing protein n=1 Tax=Okeania sp. SIO3I5 TaxID=2607805 RepID=UPI0013BB9C02|nr:cupin domain-containing protein [Okeania sp. SIO3I5]NEQ35567.1 cupin domain-containing protein [Okeania sp. SIO3I5]
MTITKEIATKDLLKLPVGDKLNNLMTIKVQEDLLAGQFSIMESKILAKTMVAPHYHEHQAQVVYVTSGELEVEVGGENGTRFTAPAGSYITLPRQIYHCFWNATNEVSTYIAITGGCGFEEYIDDINDGYLSPKPTQLGIKEAKDIHKIFFDVERIPGMLKKYGLKGLHGMPPGYKSENYSTFEDGEVQSKINLSFLFTKLIKICTSLTPKLL